MEEISNTNNYYLSIDGIKHSPIRLNSFQHENIKLTNLYCLLMFTSQFNNRKALMRYLKDLELIPEDYVGDYIAIVDRHTEEKEDKKGKEEKKEKKVKKIDVYKDTHLRIFYQRDIGYFNEEIIADFIIKNLGDPKFDEIFYERFGKRERDPITNQARKLADIIREKQSKLEYYRKEKTKALSKNNEKVYEKKAGEPSGFSKEELQKRMSELKWEIDELTNERSLLHFMYMYAERRKKEGLTEKEEEALYAGVINFVRNKTRRGGHTASSAYDYKNFIRLTNFVLDTIHDSNIGNLGFYIPKPTEEKTETYLEIQEALNFGNIFNIVNSKKHEKKYYDLNYLFGEASNDPKELHRMFLEISNAAKYVRKKDFRDIISEVVFILNQINKTEGREQRVYIGVYNYLLKIILKSYKKYLIDTMNIINRNNGFEIKEDRSDNMPKSFKDMSPDEIAFFGPLNAEPVDNMIEDDGYSFDETDIEVIESQNSEYRRSKHPYLNREYYESILTSIDKKAIKDKKAIIDLFTEISKITEDNNLKSNIRNFFAFLTKNVDRDGKFNNNSASDMFDCFVEGFDLKWDEIKTCLDIINEEYGLEKPKSY